MMSSTPVIGGVIILNKSGFHRVQFLPDLLLLKSVYFRDQNRFLVSSIRFKVLVQYVWVVTSTKNIRTCIKLGHRSTNVEASLHRFCMFCIMPFLNFALQHKNERAMICSKWPYLTAQCKRITEQISRIHVLRPIDPIWSHEIGKYQ